MVRQKTIKRKNRIQETNKAQIFPKVRLAAVKFFSNDFEMLRFLLKIFNSVDTSAPVKNTKPSKKNSCKLLVQNSLIPIYFLNFVQK